MTCFDIPKEVALVIKTAEEHKIIDAVDAYALAVTHGADWQALIDELCRWAFSARAEVGVIGHAAVVRAADSVTRTEKNEAVK